MLKCIIALEPFAYEEIQEQMKKSKDQKRSKDIEQRKAKTCLKYEVFG